MATGIVKWFDNDRGFGFIVPEHAGADVFVHITAVHAAGLDKLVPGQRLSFNLRANPRKTDRVSAHKLTVLEAPCPTAENPV